MLTTTKPRAADDLELFDQRALAAELDRLAKQHGSNEQALRRAITQPLKQRARHRARQCGAPAAAGPAGPALRRAAVPDAGRHHPHRLRVRRPSSLSVAESVRSGTHGDRRDRRLRPRADGAGLRHRSPVPAALQADRVGRVGRRGDPVLSLGSRPQGRPRHAVGRRVHPPGQGGHDDPHRAAGIAVSARRQQAVRRADDAVRQIRRAGHRAGIRRRQARRARDAPPPQPASRAIWSSPTSRTARADCATCTRCSGSRSTSIACATSRS